VKLAGIKFIKNLKIQIVLGLIMLVVTAGMTYGMRKPERQFAAPPASAKPHAGWYWMNGNISREGITADLEAMRRAGIGGVIIFNIGGHAVAGPVKVLSPEWRELMRHAIRKAGELGIEINLNNSEEIQKRFSLNGYFFSLSRKCY